jgi:carboxyl-terminal processing protease
LSTHDRENRNSNTHTESVEVNAILYHGHQLDIGYVALSKFNEKASRETKRAIELKEQGAKKIISIYAVTQGGLLSEVAGGFPTFHL